MGLGWSWVADGLSSPCNQAAPFLLGPGHQLLDHSLLRTPSTFLQPGLGDTGCPLSFSWGGAHSPHFTFVFIATLRGQSQGLCVTGGNADFEAGHIQLSHLGTDIE